MRGLTAKELRAMELIAAGFQPVGRIPPRLRPLIERGLLTEIRYDCGRLMCPGHDGLAVTTTGAWLMNVVQRPRFG